MLPFSALNVQLKQLRRGLSEKEKKDLLGALEASRKILEMQLTQAPLITGKPREYVSTRATRGVER
jgi:hypothetical protein